MLKRELLRLAFIAGVGVVSSIIFWGTTGEIEWVMLVLLPLYFIGMFFAGKQMINILLLILKTYFSIQFVSIISKSLLGSVLCVLLLVLGLGAILSVGWLYGVGKCIYSLVTAHQLDRQLEEQGGGEVRYEI